MQDTKSNPSERDHLIERLVALHLLADDERDSWLPAELARELDDSDIDNDAVTGALARLEGDGVIERTGDMVRPSRASAHLNELELIAL